MKSLEHGKHFYDLPLLRHAPLLDPPFEVPKETPMSLAHLFEFSLCQVPNFVKGYYSITVQENY